jgi:tetratricopeptide (TPR) repeat protein
VLGWGIVAKGLVGRTRPEARRTDRPAALGTATQTGPEDARAAELRQTVQARPADPTAHQELGAYQVAHGQPFEGLWELAAAHELGRDDVTLAVQMAAALQAAGLPEAAIAELTEARRRFPGQAELDLALARASLAIAKPDAAIPLLQQNPALAGSPEGLLALGIACGAAGQEAEARAALERCRARAGARPELRLALGRLALARGETRQAREDLETAVTGRPEDEETLYWAGMAYARGNSSQETTKAFDDLQRAIRAAPRKARAGYALGQLLYERQRKWEKAREIYRRATRIDPTFVEAEAGLARVTAALKLPEAAYHEARVCEMTERPDEAIPFYRRWAALQPQRWDSVLRIAECWMDMQRNAEAAREVQQGLKRYPDNPELYSHLSQIYLLLNARTDAARVCDRWTPLDTASGRPERVRGKLALAARESDAAVRWLQEAIRKNPDLSAYHADLADALLLDPTPEHLAQARPALQRAIELDPVSAGYHQQLGLVLQQLGDLEGARQAFLRSLSLDSARVEPYAGLVAVAQRLKHPATAALFARMERTVRDQQREETTRSARLWRQPRDGEARLAVAEALLRRGLLTRAQFHLQAALAQRPGWQPARSMLRRVQWLVDGGIGD